MMPSAAPRPSPKDHAPLRAGSVPYLNAAPLVHGLQGRLTLQPPSQLARALRSGAIDAALLSITEVLLQDRYDLLDGPCVASDGPVWSVFLAHRRPLGDASSIACDTASLTSVNLLRVLLAERGLRPSMRPLKTPGEASDQDYVLLIGDPALAFLRANRTHEIWDLGMAWRELTGLPFVFAAWALRREADTTFLRAELRAAADLGERELESIIRNRTEFDEAFRREYLTRHIRRRLGPEEKQGVMRFVELLGRHLGQPVYPPHYVS